jgi:two-component system, chemotaxis family, sensor kinase Cph1
LKTEIDLEFCENEPIRTPSHIQSHGVLFTLKEPELSYQVQSANAEQLLGAAFGKNLSSLVPANTIERIHQAITSKCIERINPLFIEIAGAPHTWWTGILHRNPQGILIFEIEPMVSPTFTQGFYLNAKNSIEDLQRITKIEELKNYIVSEVRKLTGFDRVMLYVFDKNWNGEVSAESLDSGAESFLNFRFPSSDIPKQARSLYALNLLRSITDVSSIPCPLVSVVKGIGSPELLDCTFSILRSVSPVHIEYLQNMGVGASLSLSLMRGGKLWGLIACHHRIAKHVPYEMRLACEFLARVFSYELANLEEREEYEYRKFLRELRASLSQKLSYSSFASALLEGAITAVDLLSADGAAILLSGKLYISGLTPSEPQILELAAWLRQRTGISTFSTSHLSEVFSPALQYLENVSGMLAIGLSKTGQDFLFAFRKEITKTVLWGGNPNQPVTIKTSSDRLHPRKSFAAWKETMRGQSRPWRQAELEAATELKESIVFEELIDLNNALEEKIQDLNAFAHIASHDLKEPLRTVNSYIRLIERQAGGAGSEEFKTYIGHALSGTKRMVRLIDSLAQISKSSAVQLDLSNVDLNVLVAQVVDDLNTKIVDTGAKIVVGKLPTVLADAVLLPQVFQNLISNALTYHSALPPLVHISASEGDAEWIFAVSDNGIGIPSASRERIFNVFYRLHGSSEYPGSGLGLAICKKIINRHQGRIWHEPISGPGSCFKFTLPL